jgi:hypothetical protein
MLDGPHEPAPLVGVEREGFPRRSGHEDGSHAELDELAGEVGRGGGIDGAVAVEDRHEGDADPGEDGRRHDGVVSLFSGGLLLSMVRAT